MSRLKRWFMRAPIGVYQVGLGGLLGRRFLLLEHTGRVSGVNRRTVLEVVEHDPGAGPIVASGFGERSDWYRNVTANPEVAFTIGRTRVVATAVRLDQCEALVVLERYRARYPKAARAIGRAIGVSLVEGLDVAAAKLPLFRLAPQRS